jgi:hypothetical protein
MMEAQSAKLVGLQPRDEQPADLFEVNVHGLGQGRFTRAGQLGLDSLHAWLEMCRTRPFGSSRIISLVAARFELQRYLRDHPRSRVADVAAAFAAGIGAISKSVDRLDARGWVTRLPNPADGARR